MELNFVSTSQNLLMNHMSKQVLKKKLAGALRGKKNAPTNKNMEMGSLKSKSGLMGQTDPDTEASDSAAPFNLQNVGYNQKGAASEQKNQRFNRNEDRDQEKITKNITKSNNPGKKENSFKDKNKKFIAAEGEDQVNQENNTEFKKKSGPGLKSKKKFPKVIEDGYTVKGEAEEFNEAFLNRFLNLDCKDDKSMAVEGFNLEKTPMTDITFDDPQISLHPTLLKSLSKMKDHTHFTKIQFNLLSNILQHNNCLIRSTTGSGKTLAYLLPIYHTLLRLKHQNFETEKGVIGKQPVVGGFKDRTSGVQALILVPTRELALQIYQISMQLSQACIYIVPGLIIGGENIQKEKSRLRKGINILIGTPSKVAYHLRSSIKNCSLLNLKWLVVEECDLSFGLGQGKFLREVLDIIKDYEINMGKGVKKGFGSFKSRAKKGDLKKLAEKQATLTEVGTATSGIETQQLAKEIDADGNEIEPENLKDMEKKIRDSIKGGYEYKGYDAQTGTFGGMDHKKQVRKDWRQEREEAMEQEEEMGNALKVAGGGYFADDRAGYIKGGFSATAQATDLGVMDLEDDAEIVIPVKSKKNKKEGDHDEVKIKFQDEYQKEYGITKLFTTASFSNKVRSVMESIVSKEDVQVIGQYDFEKESGYNDYSDIIVPEKLKQNYVIVQEQHKNSFLLCLLDTLQNKKSILFVSTADQANFMQMMLRETPHLLPRTKDTFVQKEFTKGEMDSKKLLNDLNVFKLHGHIDHNERKEVYNAFKDAESGVLISTDVGARGLDFPEVHLIILFDPPESLNHYSNKVGRTARLTASGSSLMILHETEGGVLGALKKNFKMDELDARPFWTAYEKRIPKYYPLEDATVYLTHCIKKVKIEKFIFLNLTFFNCLIESK